MANTKTGFARYTNLIIILAVCLILAAAVMLLPKGFSDDVSKIGQGSVVLVLTHDKNTVGGMLAMDMLNKIRSDYENRVEFLAVDVNTVHGRTFIRQQGVDSVVLVLFGQDGSKQGVLNASIGEKELCAALDDVLSR